MASTPASDADQGHDAALHQLWRLVDARAGARHGHAAGADAPALRPGRELMSARPSSFSPPAAPAAICSRRRRWPRALLARGRRVILVTDRAAAAFGDRLPAVEVFRITRRGLPAAACCAARQGIAQLLRGYLQARRLVIRLRPALVGGLRRLCLGADDLCRPARRAFPPCCTSRMPCWAGPTACWPPRPAPSPPPSPRPRRWATPRRASPAIPCAPRSRPSAQSPIRPWTARFACSCWAAARARASSPG